MRVRRRCWDGGEKKYGIGEVGEIGEVRKGSVDYYRNVGLVGGVRCCWKYGY